MDKRSRNPAGTVRPAIDRAALELIARHGPDATSIKQIAEQAGVAMGALYRHYPSKEALIAALFEEHYMALGARLAQLAGPAPSLSGKLAAVIGGCCLLFDQDRALFSFLLLVQHGNLRREDNVGRGTPVDAVRSLLATAHAVGELTMDPDLATALVIGCVAETATFFIYGRLTGGMADLTQTLTSSVCRAIGVAS